MEIISCYQTKNPCYIKATPIVPVGIVVHSTGVNNPNLCRYVDDVEHFGVNRYGNHWNRPDAKTLVHGAIGLDKFGKVAVANTLPYTSAAWGVGEGSKGSYNYNPTGHIQFEMCEDDLTDKAYFDEVIEAATRYCALLCKTFELPVNRIVSHKEAHDLGYGSNHGDPENWLSRFGMNMKDFRTKVQKKMEGVIAVMGKYVETEKLINWINENAVEMETTPQPEPERNPYPEPISLLRKSDSGDGVRWVQWELRRIGYDCGGIDGIFGGKTDAAVRKIQATSGLAVDGIVGPDTRAALKMTGV